MRFVYVFSFVLLFVSCAGDSLKVNVSDVKVDLKIRHLDVDLLGSPPEQLPNTIPALHKLYGDFFDIFTYRMIGIGGHTDDDFVDLLRSFVSDTLIRDLRVSVAQKIDTVMLGKQLVDAFKHYKYYFPEKEIPTIYTCISGFNQSVVVSDHLIGLSLDKYLGADCSFYERLGLPAYKRRNMHPGRAVPEMLKGWADAEWPQADADSHLLGHIIHQGKLLYFTDAMFPDLADSLKIGFTKKQLDFCKNNEAKMWAFLAEHKLLFTSERMSIKRFIDDAPYTAAFTSESPGRAAAWLGWQIVRSYMKQNKDVTLNRLMEISNSQELLGKSGYRP